MADVKPFRGIRYDLNVVGDASRVIAPPYDIVGEKLQAGLHDLHDANIVRLTNADDERVCDGARDCYDSARRYLDNWLNNGTLIQDGEPAMYLLAQDFDFNGKQTRWGFFASVKIEELDSGIVILHEATMKGPKADRIKLMTACQANLSPIFSCYLDSEGRIDNALDGIANSPPDLEADDGSGVQLRMWKIDDPVRMKAISDAMESITIFIADGHHRYESSLAYRNLIREKRSGESGPWDRTLMYLSDFASPGLIILPYHRALRHLNGQTSDDFLGHLEVFFEIEKIDVDICNVPECDGDGIIDIIAGKGSERTVFGLVLRDKDSPYLLTPRDNTAKLLEDIPGPLKTLDVSIIHKLAIEEVLHISEEDLNEGKIMLYDPDWKVIFDKVFNQDWAGAFLLNRPRVDHIREVSEAGLITPRKSTYFYPKVPSGLVIHRLKQ